MLIKVRTSSSSKFFLIHWKLTWINIRSVQFIQMSGQSVRWPGGQGGHLCSVMVMMTKTLYFDDFLKFLNCFQVFLFFFYVLNILKKKMIFLIFEKKLLCIIYFCEILWIFSKCLNFGNLFWFIEIFEMFRILCLFYFFVWFLISKKVREKNDFWIFFLILKKNTFWFFLFFQFFEILRTFWKSLIVLLFDFFMENYVLEFKNFVNNS